MSEANKPEFLIVQMLYWREQNFMKHIALVSSDWLLVADGDRNPSFPTLIENGNLVYLKWPHGKRFEQVMPIEPWQLVPYIILAHNKDWRRLLPDVGHTLEPNKQLPRLNPNAEQNHTSAKSEDRNSDEEGKGHTGASCSIHRLQKDPLKNCSNLLLSVEELQQKVHTIQRGLVDIMRKLTTLHSELARGGQRQGGVEEQEGSDGRNATPSQSLELALLEACTEESCGSHSIDVENIELKSERSSPVFSSAHPTDVLTSGSLDGKVDGVSTRPTQTSQTCKKGYFSKNVREESVCNPQTIQFGTRSLTAADVNRCNHMGKVSSLAVELFCKLFSREEMALSSLTGRSPNGHKHFLPKKKLDEHVIHGIVDYICRHHKNILGTRKVEYLVRKSIAIKLNNFSRTPEAKAIQCCYRNELAKTVG